MKKLRYFYIISCLAVLLPMQAAAEDAGTDFAELHFVDHTGHIFRASSTLEDPTYSTLGTYGMQNIFDGDSYTGWSEGMSGDGEGTVLWLQVDKGSDTMLVKNGFARTAELFKKNNRVKTVDISLWYGMMPAGMVSEYGPAYVLAQIDGPERIRFDDSMALQVHDLSFDYSTATARIERFQSDFPAYAEGRDLPRIIEKTAYLIRIEIIDAYGGSSWTDTCLTELRCFDRANFKALEMESLNGALRYRGADHGWRYLFSRRDRLYGPYLLSPDGRWCVAFSMPAEAEGRVETGYVLFRLPWPEEYRGDRKFITAVESGKLPLDFEEENGKTFLLFDDGSRIELTRQAE